MESREGGEKAGSPHVTATKPVSIIFRELSIQPHCVVAVLAPSSTHNACLITIDTPEKGPSQQYNQNGLSTR